ncbi:MAG: ferrous iron transport protein A [Clostridia bacterium]|nr:ferrous iron transport protein A [Clostridia bacterium]
MEKSEKSRHLCLRALPVGESAFIESVDMPPRQRTRLSALGMSAGAEISCLGKAPFGDPSAYLVGDRVLAIRGADAEKIYCVI